MAEQGEAKILLKDLPLFKDGHRDAVLGFPPDLLDAKMHARLFHERLEQEGRTYTPVVGYRQHDTLYQPTVDIIHLNPTRKHERHLSCEDQQQAGEAKGGVPCGEAGADVGNPARQAMEELAGDEDNADTMKKLASNLERMQASMQRAAEQCNAGQTSR